MIQTTTITTFRTDSKSSIAAFMDCKKTALPCNHDVVGTINYDDEACWDGQENFFPVNQIIQIIKQMIQIVKQIIQTIEKYSE
jgi:hypothetical protein